MSTFVDLLRQIEPEYDRLKEILENGPRVFANITKRHRSWCVHLQEEINSNNFSDKNHLTEKVDWTTEQLKNWPDVRRTAYDMWFFSRKKDAEKFQTLYNLKWAR